MKKVCLGLFFAVLSVGSVFAGCNTDHTLTFSGTQTPKDNEFLYMNEAQWQATVQGYQNTRHQNSGDGKGYECDTIHSSGCTPGQEVSMPGGHYYMGKKIAQPRRYKCVSWVRPLGMIAGLLYPASSPLAIRPQGDYWAIVDDGMCNSRQFGDIPVGGAYKRELSKAECSGYNKTDETHGVSFQLVCQQNRNLLCVATKCDDPNMVVNSKGICEKKEKPQDKGCTVTIKGNTITVARGAEYNVDLTANECQGIVGTPSVAEIVVGAASYDSNAVYHFFCGPMCKKVSCKSGYELNDQGNCVKKGGGKTCRELRAGMSVEAIACCDTGKDADWKNGECKCKDQNTHFEIVNGRGKCVANGQTVLQCPQDARPSDDRRTCICNDPTKQFVFINGVGVCQGGSVQPTKCPKFMELKDGECVCKEANQKKDGDKCICDIPDAKNDDNGICKCNDPEKIVVNGKCDYDESVLVKIRAEISAIFGRLNTSIGGFEKSVWKNTEGEFNTARLASDAIAGVVLGTAGGIITSKIVKKNQLKQGFEDINCSIGGQKVADYGDSFTVGM